MQTSYRINSWMEEDLVVRKHEIIWCKWPSYLQMRCSIMLCQTFFLSYLTIHIKKASNNSRMTLWLILSGAYVEFVHLLSCHVCLPFSVSLSVSSLPPSSSYSTTSMSFTCFGMSPPPSLCESSPFLPVPDCLGLFWCSRCISRFCSPRVWPLWVLDASRWINELEIQARELWLFFFLIGPTRLECLLKMRT